MVYIIHINTSSCVYIHIFIKDHISKAWSQASTSLFGLRSCTITSTDVETCDTIARASRITSFQLLNTCDEKKVTMASRRKLHHWNGKSSEVVTSWPCSHPTQQWRCWIWFPFQWDDFQAPRLIFRGVPLIGNQTGLYPMEEKTASFCYKKLWDMFVFWRMSIWNWGFMNLHIGMSPGTAENSPRDMLISRNRCQSKRGSSHSL